MLVNFHPGTESRKLSQRSTYELELPEVYVLIPGRLKEIFLHSTASGQALTPNLYNGFWGL
jgi:hypothetical protein